MIDFKHRCFDEDELLSSCYSPVLHVAPLNYQSWFNHTALLYYSPVWWYCATYSSTWSLWNQRVL